MKTTGETGHSASNARFVYLFQLFIFLTGNHTVLCVFSGVQNICGRIRGTFAQLLYLFDKKMQCF